MRQCIKHRGPDAAPLADNEAPPSGEQPLHDRLRTADNAFPQPAAPRKSSLPRSANTMTRRRFSRRTFLTTSASAAGAAATFMIVPRHVLGGPGQTPPSERINVAGIGC